MALRWIKDAWDDYATRHGREYKWHLAIDGRTFCGTHSSSYEYKRLGAAIPNGQKCVRCVKVARKLKERI